MCGIAGYIQFQKESSFAIDSLLAVIKHRGPDETESITGENFAIGVNRLAILSPLEPNTQPLWSPDGRFCFVFNGEVYNFKEIKKELIEKGWTFKTSCDGEVLFYSYLEYGAEAFLKCEGMFACAIFDKLSEKWILARDPFGIKPLYFQKTKKWFAFASEIKPLLKLQKPTLKREALAGYLQRRFVPGENTLFSGILRVKPGTIIEASSEALKSHIYWKPQLSPVTSLDKKKRFADFSDQFEHSVKLTVKSDVGFGSLLSGGVDSTTLTCLASKFNKNFTAYFFDNGYDSEESFFANKAAKQSGLPLKTVKLQEEDFLLLPKIINHLEEPLGDSIIIPTYKLLKEVSQHEKVLIAGEGADEIFGGYVHHFLFYLLEKVFPLKIFLKPLIKSLPEKTLNVLFPYPGRIKKEDFLKALDDLSQSGLENFIKTTHLFTATEIKKLIPDLMIPESSPNKIRNLKDLMKWDIQNWLPNYNLLRTDKLSMAHSLEVRVPYLNRRFAETCLRLPLKDIISIFMRKKILRKFAYRQLNLDFKTAYRKKHPFTFKDNLFKKYREFLMDHLDKSFAENLSINPIELKKQINIKENNLKNQKQLTALLNLAIWHKEFF